jgi:hypothetical protein
MIIISPRFACYKLVAVVDTIIGVLNQDNFNAAQGFVRGGHFMTLEYVTNGSFKNNAGIGQFQL